MAKKSPKALNDGIDRTPKGMKKVAKVKPLTPEQQEAVEEFNEFVERQFEENFPDWVFDVLSNFDITTTEQMVDALNENVDEAIFDQYSEDVVGSHWPTPQEIEERLWMHVREKLGIKEFVELPKAKKAPAKKSAKKLAKKK